MGGPQDLGAIVNVSRTWGNQVFVLVDYDGDEKERLTSQLVRRHVAWVIALAYQLRKSSRLTVSHGAHVFDGRSAGLEDFHTAKPAHYEVFLAEDEREALKDYANPATHIIRRQGDELRALFDAGKIDNNRFVSMMNTLGDLYDCQGKCERIKNTPFPRQITYFGRSFAWIFIFLLPLSFVEFFSQEAAEHHLGGWAEHEYVMILVPFTVLVSMIFFLIEKVSESCEDPFEWGTTDVSIAALSRVIEIDLRQMLGDTDVPAPIAPRNGVVY